MRECFVAVMLLVLPSCSVHYVAPPRAPARHGELLAPVRPPSAEEGTLTLYANGPSRVELVTGRTHGDPMVTPWITQQPGVVAPLAGQLTLRPLCHTPCAVNLPRGDHELLFTDVSPSTGRIGMALARVGDRPAVLRHTLGRQTYDVAGLVGAISLGGVGLVSAAIGGMLLGFGTDSDGNDLRVAGGVMLGLGTAIGIGSVVLGMLSRPTFQPGATTQWTP